MDFGFLVGLPVILSAPINSVLKFMCMIPRIINLFNKSTRDFDVML